MTAETGRRASRLELIRARLHESAGRRCARDGDATAPTATPASNHDVRRSPPTGRVTHRGVRPAFRAADPPDRRGSRVDSKPDRKVQSGNTNHDRQVPAVGRRAEVKGRLKLDSDGPEYAQVRKPTAASSLHADRGQTGVEGTGRLTSEQNDSTTSEARRVAQKTSSSSSLLSRSQNFFARLRSRKNDPSRSAKSVSRDRGSADDGASKTKIRRSVSESGCALYASRGLVADDPDSVEMSQSSGQIVGTKPEVVDGTAAADATNDHVTTASVYAEVEAPSTNPDVVQPTESTSDSMPAGSRLTPVYEECAGSYSLREALLQRAGEPAATETPTSMTSSHIIRRESATSSPQSDDHQTRVRQTQASSLPAVGGAVSCGCRSMSLAGWRRRKLGTHSSGCIVGARRDARLERIQEVDSPPGSAGDDEMSSRAPCHVNSDVTEQRVRSGATQPSSDARNCKFTALLVRVLETNL